MLTGHPGGVQAVAFSPVARDLIGREEFKLVDSARLLAMANLSAADAWINCWNDKYYWDGAALI
jgi:hypothetical protein